MSIHKLTAGAGYDYLTRQVAALDATEKGHTGLASYYTERGETPGVWIGSGLDAIEGLTAAIASGADIKIVQQMLGHKSAVMTLDQYGHLFDDRLDIVADAMDAARTSALAGGYPVGTGGEVVELRRDAK